MKTPSAPVWVNEPVSYLFHLSGTQVPFLDAIVPRTTEQFVAKQREGLDAVVVWRVQFVFGRLSEKRKDNKVDLHGKGFKSRLSYCDCFNNISFADA